MPSPMEGRTATFCFGCTRELAHPHQIHRGEDGIACRACVDRVLESLPSLLPSRAHDPLEAAESEAPWSNSEGPGFYGSLYEPPEPA